MIQRSISLYDDSPTIISLSCLLPKAPYVISFTTSFFPPTLTLYNNILQDLNRQAGATVSGALQKVTGKKKQNRVESTNNKQNILVFRICHQYFIKHE